jgi:hypothetical protein
MDKSHAHAEQPPEEGTPTGPEAGQESGQERCEAALERLRAASEGIKRFVNDFLAAKGLQDDDRVISDKVWEALNGSGIRSEGCALHYGYGRNVEGSLSIDFEGASIIFRWGGDHAIYLNGDGNYATWGDRTEIKRLDGLPVEGITAEGVILGGDAEYRRKTWNWRQAREKRDRWLKETEGAKLTGFFKSKIKPEPPDPGPPPELPAKTVPHDRYIEVAETMSDGLERALSALETERRTRKFELDARRGQQPYR